MGDMKYARAVDRFSVSMFEALFMPEFKADAGGLGLRTVEGLCLRVYRWLEEALGKVDIVGSRRNAFSVLFERGGHNLTAELLKGAEDGVIALYPLPRVDWVACLWIRRDMLSISDGRCVWRSSALWFSEVPFIEVAGYPAAVFGQVIVYAWAFAVWVPPLYFKPRLY